MQSNPNKWCSIISRRKPARSPRRSILSAAIGVWFALATSGYPATNALHRAVSGTGQFVAFAPRPSLPAALCAFAERVKRAWLRELDLRDEWRDPIIVVVRDDVPAVSTGMFVTDLHLKYEIRCGTPPALDEPALLAGVVETLCAELANRHQPAGKTVPYVAAPSPAWLIHGLAQSIQGRQDLLLAVTRRALTGGRPPTARSLLVAPGLPADAAERQVFQANAWLLADALRALPGGARKLTGFIAELGARKSAADAFAEVYRNDFPDEASLEKWWSLQALRPLQTLVPGNLTAGETGRQLDEILRTRLARSADGSELPEEREVPLDQLRRAYEQKWFKALLREKANRLAMLHTRAHPLYRQAIGQYLEALQWLAAENLTRFRHFWTVAGKSRQQAESESGRITAYMDQAERVHAASDAAGAFNGFFRTFDELDSLEKQRRNPISDYLDKFDK